jgi:hypothetical protein
MINFPTPISVLESYFNRQLTLNDMGYWDTVKEDIWIDFAKTYLAQMKLGFTAITIAEHTKKTRTRLYFDPRFGEAYDTQIAERYQKTPLLGHSPYPHVVDAVGDINFASLLNPLKKHLLVADELWIPDNFYRCFDFVADSFSRKTWHLNPNTKSAVYSSIAAMKLWLPILATLRKLIVSGALKFMPYYAVPSFPYAGGNPFMTKQMARLVIPRDPSVKIAGEFGADFGNWSIPPEMPKGPFKPRLDCNAATYAWLNARLLGLDPVFADEGTWRWASGIKFRSEPVVEKASDLMSIDILPLGNMSELSIDTVYKMRKNDEVFSHIRNALTGCKVHIETQIKDDADDDFIRKACRDYVRDQLDPEVRLKHLKFLDNSLFGSSIFSVAVGAAFMGANPWLGLLVPAALTPKAFLAAEGRLNPRIRAKARLEALL